MALYPSQASGIDLRQEMIDTIYGSLAEEGIGIPVLIRRMRRDEVTGAMTRCACVDPITREPDLDIFCPLCHGMGYYWDEEWFDTYKTVVSGTSASLSDKIRHRQSGNVFTQTYRFFFDYTANLIEGDKLVELALDVEGNIARPYRRTLIWTPNTIERKRLDSGRIEFYIATCQHTNAIYIEKDEEIFINNP